MLSRFAVVLVLVLGLALTDGARISSNTQITQKLRQRTQTKLTTGATTKDVFDECFPGTVTSPSCDVTDPVDSITKISDECKSTPKKGTIPLSAKVSTKICITPTAGAYNGKCCCVYQLKGRAQPFVLCDATVSSPTTWTAPVPPKLPTMKAVKLSIKTISDPGVSSLRSAIGTSHGINLLTNPKYRIKLEGTMTEYPPSGSNVLDHIALRLNILDADVRTYHKLPLAPILHQTGLYRRLLLEDSLKTDETFLRVVVLGIANLHAAIKMVQFLSEDPGNALVPVFSDTGDHFLAKAIIGTKNNDYNGFMLHPLQIQGHYDPADAVGFLRKKVKSLDPKTDQPLQTLLIRTLGLDMSVWGRLKSPNMRFNGAITDDDWSNLYLHIQDLITNNAGTYITELSK